MMKKLLKLSSVFIIMLSFCASFILNVNAAETITLEKVIGEGDPIVNLFDRTSDNIGDGSTFNAVITDVNSEERKITVELTISNAGNTDLTKDRNVDMINIALPDEVKKYYDVTPGTPSAGTISNDESEYAFTWLLGNLAKGDSAKLSYVLTLKEGQEKAVENKTMEVLAKGTSAITVDSGTSNTLYKSEDNCKVPSFVLKIAVDNSKTGVFTNYIFIGLAAIAAIALVIVIRKKTDISKI